eukprot:TRINITY_DN9825_c0_g1_i1.p1 TRINITY_DN9825_c0_g1~~TRINITY_DN9825_c0_g1_i1.p1  ORF type:complete len:100 (+),score=13.90 TRINITY_DN9825_c0_g1_i1:1531-1830(+)
MQDLYLGRFERRRRKKTRKGRRNRKQVLLFQQEYEQIDWNEIKWMFKVNGFRIYKKTQALTPYFILSQMKAYLISLRSNEIESNIKDDVLDEIHTMLLR